MTKKYYLETNTIIQLCHRLKSPFIKDQCFTSALVIAELLKNFRSNFQYRKNMMQFIKDSGIFIDWRSLLEVMLEAYDGRYPEIHLKQDVITKTNYDTILNADSMDNFDQLRGLIFNRYDFFKRPEGFPIQKSEYDDYLNHLLDNGVKYLSEKMDKSISNLFEMQEIKNIQSVSYEDFIKSASIEMKKGNNAISYENEYNGKLDFYLKASFYYSLNRKTVKRNDTFDLAHFKFIESKDQVIVSNDNLIKEICMNLFPDQYMNNEDFKKLL